MFIGRCNIQNVWTIVKGKASVPRSAYCLLLPVHTLTRVAIVLVLLLVLLLAQAGLSPAYLRMRVFLPTESKRTTARAISPEPSTDISLPRPKVAWMT